MAVDVLANIRKEKEIVKELIKIYHSYSDMEETEQAFMKLAAHSLINELKMLSESVSSMLIREVPKPVGYHKVSTPTGVVYVDKKMKKRFMQETGVSDKILGKLKRKRKLKQSAPAFKRPSFFSTFASNVFRKFSSNLLDSGMFQSLKVNLKRANMNYLASSYLSLTFLISFIVLIISLAIGIGLSDPSTLGRNIIIVILVTIATFFFTVNYPGISASSVKKRLEDELPFAISHMSAIASSRVEPSKIFPIMAKVKDYPLFAREAKKIVNQMNVYGYDFVNALKNSAKMSPSEKLEELFNGIATNTVTGGSLVKYLEEKAKDSLVDYRLARQKYGEVVGMLSDIYTALLIAAPLILMLILAIMSVVGSSFIGMSVTSLATLGLAIIIVLNIIFLIFIHITQPKK
ncbi:MAG: type II secretion system F family protein [archaeon]|nr:MAG: type II secretion system F family protein [archaeon]